MIALLFDTPQDSTPDAIDCAIDRHIHVGLGILGHDIGQAGQHDMDAAFLIDAAARSIDIGQPHRHMLHLIGRVLQREAQAALSVIGKRFGQRETLGLDIDFDGNLLGGSC